VSERTEEEKYFHKLDEEAKARLRAEQARVNTAATREERRLLHADHCGRCGGLLFAQAFRGLEIHRCADCGAVLLDPGELEQIADHDRGRFFGDFLGAFGRNR
jgi:Zn-finger nucleic acid-binding protein